MRQRLFGRAHADCAKSLHFLAVLALRNDDVTRSETLQRESLALIRERLGPKHPRVAQGLQHMAAIDVACGRLESARDALLLAVDICTSAFGGNQNTLVAERGTNT